MEQDRLNFNFVVIDDDALSNFISETVIRQCFPGAGMVFFTKPEDGHAHIMSACNSSENCNIVVLLDIEMPGLDGWQMLDELAKIDRKNSIAMKVYIVSVSIDPEDIKRGLENPLVAGYIPKPLTVRKVATHLEGDLRIDK